MKVLYRISSNEIKFKHAGLGLGNFDGIHLGHSKIINTLKSECGKRGIPSVIYTFRRHPETVLRKNKETPIIITNEQKVSILEETGIDYVFFEEFDENYANISPEDFVKEILIKEFDVQLLVVGYDYTFGIKGEGKANDLIEYGLRYNFDVLIVPPVTVEGTIASSTILRELIKNGDMASYLRMTGRHYSIPGEVSVGRRVGTKIGFPTANILPREGFALPGSGVYATKTMIEGQVYGSITNIGNNPTFGCNQVTIETHIFDYDRKLYGQLIEVFFYRKIRDEIVFSGVDALKEQLKADIEEAKSILE